MKIELSDADADLLTLAIGLAAVAAYRGGNRELFVDLLRLANTVHKHNPRWAPYDLSGKNFPERRV